MTDPTPSDARATSHARDMLADRGYFPSAGSVPFGVVESLIEAALALPKPALAEGECTCQRYPTHCANDCPSHGLSSPTYTAGERVDVPPALPSPLEGDWVAVPRAPNKAMVEAGKAKVGFNNPYPQDVATNVYLAMLASAPPAPAGDGVAEGAVAEIAAERRRQVEVEGFTAERDDAYTDFSLAKAASAYAAVAGWPDHVERSVAETAFPEGHGLTRAMLDLWPKSWAEHWFKPVSRRADLIKAGALIIAEIERLDRENIRG